MTDITVKSLAEEIKTSVDYLLQKFAAVGLNKTAVDSITQQEKESLLVYLNSESYSSNINNKLTLQRKIRSTLNIINSSGKSKYVQIEVRKKSTYIQKYKNKKLEHREYDKLHELLDKTSVKLPLAAVGNKLNENIFCSDVEKSCIEDKNNINKEVKKNDVVLFDKKEINNHIVSEQVFFNVKNKIAVKKLIEDNVKNYYADSATKEKDDVRKREECERNTRRSIKKVKNKNKKINIFSNLKLDSEEINIIDFRSVKNKTKIKFKNSNLIQSFQKPVQVINRDVVIVGETISVAELSNKMAVKASQVIKYMMKLGVMVTINQVIDQETAQLVAEEMGHKVIIRRENEIEESVISDNYKSSNAELRAPVVTIMGHVDHGKTSLLDYIRLTKVAVNEEGGITQHIGAYHVETDNGMITFIDTPGHAAFTAMRVRGAKVTDIIVLVVAADDGVMPQTIESIQHARAAHVPVVVAINKIDKHESDPNRVKNELLQYNLIPEEWGGENQFVNVSAKYGDGIEDLLDAILLQAEVLELKAIRHGIASGVVIESCLDKSRGPLATILVAEGTLKCGDVVLCGLEYGRVRAMRDELGKNIYSAGPSIPVEILGLSGITAAGDTFTVVYDEKKAREVALYRQVKYRAGKLADRQQNNKIENIFPNITKEEKSVYLNIVLKADVQGTAEAISDSLKQLSTDEVKINIIGSGVGSITETDAMLAAASHAILLGFNVRAGASARRVIESEKLDIRYYSVIYELLNEVKVAMSCRLAPEYKKEILGRAEVRNVFRSTKFGVIAGCMITEGVAMRNARIRVLRENIVIYEGELESIRHFKEDVNEIHNGMECGIGVKNYNDVLAGDIIEIFNIYEIKRVIN